MNSGYKLEGDLFLFVVVERAFSGPVVPHKSALDIELELALRFSADLAFKPILLAFSLQRKQFADASTPLLCTLYNP